VGWQGNQPRLFRAAAIPRRGTAKLMHDAAREGALTVHQLLIAAHRSAAFVQEF
jgi:hypothetical protein